MAVKDTVSGKTNRMRGTGSFEAILCAFLLYGVYDQTPLGAVGELLVRTSLGQEFTPSWFATFRGKEVQLKTSELEKFGTLVETSERSPVVDAIAQEVGVEAAFLDALVQVHGQCVSETRCTMSRPDHLPQLLDQFDLTDDVHLRDVAHGLRTLQDRFPLLSSPSERITGLYIGPRMTKRAVTQAERSNLINPSDIETFASFLPPGLRRGSLQQAAKALAFYRMRQMTWPLETTRRITSPFGPRVHPVTKQQKFHNGIDVAAPVGTPLQAPFAGNVARVSSDSVSGTYVKIDHGLGIETAYAHLSEVVVDERTHLAQHSLFAKTGVTGRTTGPHLHYIIRVDGQPVDPRPFGGPAIKATPNRPEQPSRPSRTD